MSLTRAIDHLLYAAPDLGRGVAQIEALLGVRPSPGGSHPGLGTRNALVALGPESYLEIIAPDPGQPPPGRPRPFGIDGLTAPRLAAWAARADSLERLAAEAAREGIRLGKVTSASRHRPDGALLSWRFTDPWTVVEDGIVPFFIDWGESPHPARTAAGGATLVSLRAEHPDPGRVAAILGRLDVPLEVAPGAEAALVAQIDCPNGRVDLR
jgi:hypothetical protein